MHAAQWLPLEFNLARSRTGYPRHRATNASGHFEIKGYGREDGRYRGKVPNTTYPTCCFSQARTLIRAASKMRS
jgi:hypothetical protein